MEKQFFDQAQSIRPMRLPPAHNEETNNTTTTTTQQQQVEVVTSAEEAYKQIVAAKTTPQPTKLLNEPHVLEEDDSNDSQMSNISEMSDMSGREWKPVCSRPIRWVQKQIQTGANPRLLLSQMLPAGNHQFAAHINDMTLWRILASILSEPPRRQKLRHINTFTDVVELVKRSKNIIVLTGAGVSVSCGIPDFRSSDGIYARLAKDYPDLPDPQAMFDISHFARDPRPFYKFAREIYPGQFKPSPCHSFIKRLEQQQQLLRNYTQNIDTLEQVAGIHNVIECHGSFSTASCTKCKYKCTANDIREDIFAQRIPLCPHCQPHATYNPNVSESEPTASYLARLVENGIMKPDIVFFGEGLPDEFHTVMAHDKTKCDLLIVIGSSLKVRPVALIPSSLPAHVPQILINREQLPHLVFDVQLLGDSDVIINQLCHRLGAPFNDICYNDKILKETLFLRSCGNAVPLSSESTTSDMSNDVTDSSVHETSEEDEKEEEECAPQQVDTDSQSVKSNTSADLALRLVGTYSDSGFESSTSSLHVATGLEPPPPPPPSTATATAEVEEILGLDLADFVPVPCPKTVVIRHNEVKRRNSAACLFEGTFYCNKKKSAYVFPGAQVTWYSSSSSSSSSEAEEELDEQNVPKKRVDYLTSANKPSTSSSSSPSSSTSSVISAKTTTTINNLILENNVDMPFVNSSSTPNMDKRCIVADVKMNADDAPPLKKRRDECEPSMHRTLAITTTNLND